MNHALWLAILPMTLLLVMKPDGLGAVSVDAFRYALESRFSSVAVKLGSPQFPTVTQGGFYAAVQPSFVSFEATDPVVFRFENYTARVVFDVSVHDASGKVIHARTYTGEGAERGSIGAADPGHAAYPVATQKAIKHAVEQFVGDLKMIANRH